MFFIEERSHFFKPLSGKYREQVAQCLALLYQRQYGSTADYGQALGREQLIEILEEALAASMGQVLDSGDTNVNTRVGSDQSGNDPRSNEHSSDEQRFRSKREQANWVLKQLLDCGWVERQVDTASLQSSFAFTRMGRLFALALQESDSTHIRTRHRNTRNTLNALEAFHSRGEIYDLLDAYDYSERIITDFTDVIAELEERKRALVKELESQQLIHKATDQFFDFMEKRFQPDISVRLSADSVEKHRDDIEKIVLKIRRKPKEFKQNAERELRRVAPELCDLEQSFLWFVLGMIERRMLNAAEIMLPALRRALHGFTKRADIIIRQLSYLSSQKDDNLLEICRELSTLPDEQCQQRFDRAASVLGIMKIQLVDPQSIKLQERQQKMPVDSLIKEQKEIDPEARKNLVISQMLDQAFVVNNKNVKDYVTTVLQKGQKILTSELEVNDASDLLALAHITDLAAVNSLASDFMFKVEPTGKIIHSSDYYVSCDEFSVELIDDKCVTND